MKKIEVYNEVENGKLAIGVKINDDQATVQDLLDVWQPLCDDSSIHKSYAAGYHDICKGCQVNCCNTAYVIPDIVSFKKMPAQLGLDYESFIRLYFHKEKLDIGLLRMQPNPCIFLKDNICSIYQARSLICRFYICSPIVGSTEELIYKISWTGVAATQVFAEQKGLIKPSPNAAYTSFDLLFCRLIEEYRDSEALQLFLNAGSYADIPLQIFLAGKE